MLFEALLKPPPFDLEVLLPVYPQGRWLKRLETFRRFGLIGSHRFKVRLVLLAGTCELDPELHQADAWQGVSEVVVVRSFSDPPAPKIYNYYANVLPHQGLQARWYLRVDDDSLTDLDRLIEHLNTTFDWRDPLHLAGSVNYGIEGTYAEILREVDGPRLFNGSHICQLFCEWEASLTSAVAMGRILENEKARELLRRAALVQEGCGDVCLTLAARICGLVISQVPFMTVHCQVDEFAAFTLNGHGLFHIHFLSPDNEEMWPRYMDKRRQFGLPTDT